MDRVRFDDPTDFDRWQEYIQARPDSHCADLAEWRPLYRQLYGFEDHSFLATRQGRTVGALSLYSIHSPFMGRMLVSCPFFGYGGLYWEDETVRDALLDRAWETAQELRADYIELRLTEPLPPPYEVNEAFSEFNLEFAATPEQTWEGALSSNVRQNVRKSMRNDLEFHLQESYRPCYGLLQRTLRAHGTPFHGERFFKLLVQHLADRVRFSEVRQSDQLVAAGVVIRFKETILAPYIGSLAQSRASRANYLQYWRVVESYLQQGVRTFEFGRSPRGSTHAKFKKKWGCRELPLFYNYRVVNPGRGYRSVSEPSSLQLMATRIWKQLPLVVTTALGPRLFRYIP